MSPQQTLPGYFTLRYIWESKTKQVLKLLNKVQLKFKCENKVKNKLRVHDMTHKAVGMLLTTELYFKKNYLQKIRKWEKQIKKMMAKQATMGMRTQSVFFV